MFSVSQENNNLGITKKFDWFLIEKVYILKILRDIDTSKAAGIYRLPGRFSKDGANVIVKPVTFICNFLISLNRFLGVFKVAKVKPILKQTGKLRVWLNGLWFVIHDEVLLS